MIKHYCKDCFKATIDPCASDKLLLLSGEDKICPCCRKLKPIVAAYYKFGEHEVTIDGKHIKDECKHVGVNKDYCPWSDSYPYPRDTPEEGAAFKR